MNMISRCHNPKNGGFHLYGGRGIKVCDEWKNDFEQFAEWALNNGYDETAEFGKCTIDRIDVNGNYEPSNCRFVSLKEQARNRRNNVFIDINGERILLKDFCKESGLDYHILRNRLKDGWSAEEAINTPLEKDSENYSQKRSSNMRNKRKSKSKPASETLSVRRLLKPSEARNKLACSTAEMYRLLKEGEIPSIRRGNRWYIVPADLECYIEKMKGEGA